VIPRFGYRLEDMRDDFVGDSVVAPANPSAEGFCGAPSPAEPSCDEVREYAIKDFRLLSAAVVQRPADSP
jgi:hypothetical protein